MKKHSILAIMIVLLLLHCLRAYGDIGIIDTEKNKLQLFGFFKLDAVYQDGGVNGLTFPRYAMPGDGNLYLSATHSRFGFKYAGTPLSNGMNVAAVLEWDFFDTTSANQMKPRFRQGYFTLSKKGHSLLFGQAWDLFSPLGPTTLMTNGYLWQTGNVGFRHAQMRYSYSAPRYDFAVSLSDPATAGGWSAIMPVLQARIGGKLDANNKFQLGISGIYGRENAKIQIEENAWAANKIDVIGWSLDWNLAFCKLLALKGEYASGKNLSYVASRANYFYHPLTFRIEGEESTSFWSELLLVRNKLSSWLGYAFEDLGLGKNECLLAGAQYAAGSGVSFGLEFAHFANGNPGYLDAKTNQVMFSAILSL